MKLTLDHCKKNLKKIEQDKGLRDDWIDTNLTDYYSLLINSHP